MGKFPHISEKEGIVLYIILFIETTCEKKEESLHKRDSGGSLKHNSRYLRIYAYLKRMVHKGIV